MMKLKTTQFIHLFFCGTIVLFSVIAFLVNKNNLFFAFDFTNTAPFNPMFPIFAVVGIILGIIIFNKKIAAISSELSFDEKFMQYQTAFLIRCAFFEAGALLNIVGFLMTKNLFFLLFAFASFIALLLSRPSKSNVIANLQLQYPDTKKL